MMAMKPQQWQLLAALADGLPKHVFELCRLLNIKSVQINGLWQKMPPHIRGLLRQQDGQWRLIRPLAVFDDAALTEIGQLRNFQAALFNECGSSNDVVMEKAKSSPQNVHRYLVVAHQQNAGRGRQGRKWQSRLGECLMFSFGWVFDKQQSDLGALALVAALACHRVLNCLGVPVQIKWPNDLVCGAQKLGGILIETVRSGGQTTVIAGIGINFVLPKEVSDSTSIQAALHEAGRGQVSAATVFDGLLSELSALFEQFAQKGFAPLMGEYEQANRDYHQPVKISRDGQLMFEGNVTGVSEQGALLLQTDQGLQTIVSGEVSLRPNLQRPSEKMPSKRYLLLDGGNSQLKWAWVKNGEIERLGKAPYRDLSALNVEWTRFSDGLSRIIGCAVCGEAKKAQVAEQLSENIEWLSSMPQSLGVRNHYRNVAEHGADRWFNVLGSRQFTPNAAVVVSCGTAVTADALTDDNHYLGGTIMPGFHLMKESMAQKTANLNRPIGRVYAFPTTTPNALASGMMDAVCGSVCLMHSRLQSKVGTNKKVDVVITGGGAAKVAEALPEAFRAAHTVKIVENLVIHGLLNWVENH